MARKALVTAFSITVLLLVAAPSMANFFGPGFGLNGLPCGWGPLAAGPASLAASPCNTICGSGVIGAGVAPFGCGTVPSCAIAGPSYAGSPGVFCSGFPGLVTGVPVPIPTMSCIPAAPCAPVCAPPCGVPAIAPACGITK
ncbi:MAG TPA: hypothetical protein VMC61_01140 [Methanocella sp.]|nr:hypothetical protein [Methanocella sp.]